MHARTAGGLVAGAQVLRVTNLRDDGPGSLRAALITPGRRVILFEVGGPIDLTRRIDVRAGELMIAGQSAPSPGIIVRGAGIAIRTSDVRIEHIGIYPGAPRTGTDPRAVDAIQLISRADRREEVRRVVLRNLTLAHATDENVSFAGDALGSLRLETSLVAKGLREAGHPRGVHSMGMLIYADAEDIAVSGNIFANNDRRNPVITPGVHGVFANNLVYGFGRNPINVQRNTSRLDLRASVVGNVVWPSLESTCGLPAVEVPPGVYLRAPNARLHLNDNVLQERFGGRPHCEPPSELHRLVRERLLSAPPAIDPDWRILASANVPDFVLAHAGSRPSDRNPVDSLIIGGVRDGSGRMIDSPADDGGWPDIPETRRVLPADIPGTLRTSADVARLAAWLCSQHRAVGGAENMDCPARQP